jgi:molybdopterin converting factor subunit 1
MMTIKILFFGITTDLTKTSEISFQMPKNATVKECKWALIGYYPSLKNINSYAIAVNESYAEDDLVLQSNDVVAIIPPVSGG